MTPDLQADVSLIELGLYAALNPATISVAFLMGRKADEKGKIVIAAFAGAIAGVVLLYFAALLRIADAPSLARAAAGIFATSLIAGSVYAAIGYAFRR